MFSLIITIVSIVLVVALASITSYFGQSTSAQSQNDVAVAKSMNEVNQLRSSLVLFKANTGTSAVSLDQLTAADYLKVIPAGWASTVTVGSGYAANQLIGANDAGNIAVCNEVNKRLGVLTATQSCAAATLANPTFSGCCTG